jgi:dihydroorotate dehydrogenase (NAD+) catalytic subunit
MRHRSRRTPAGEWRVREHVDLRTCVGSLELPNPVLTASGTAGHGAELAAYLDLAHLGAHVVKSLAAFAWAGNPAPRLHPTAAGMINAVGLQGPGVDAWRRDDLPALASRGVRTVASIWGRTVEEYAAAAAALAGAPGVVAVEVNLSCPNLAHGACADVRRGMFAHDPAAAAEVVAATAACGVPRWAKLSPNTDRLLEVAGAVRDAGAEAVTLVNTLLGMVLDPHSGLPALGNGGGGVSGPAIHPVAVRAVFDVRAAYPDLPIVGVGGVHDAASAAALVLAGAQAVQVGTATFADPRAPQRVLDGLERWCLRHGVVRLADIVGAAHRGGLP